MSRARLLIPILSFTITMPARAGSPPAKCWAKDPNDRYIAYIPRPAKNFRILYGPPRSLADVAEEADVVVNGTFFVKKKPLTDVIVDGKRLHQLKGTRRIVKDKRDGRERRVDFSKRWGIGVEFGSNRLVVKQGTLEAEECLSSYLGGGGLLLKNGKDMSALNWPRKGWGPNFSALGVLATPSRRTALGIINDKKTRKQTLVLVVSEKPITIPQLAYIMKEKVRADDAVFYDGGRAVALAAGGQILIQPSEEPNPTHIALSCR